MQAVVEQLDALRKSIAVRNEPETPSEYLQRLCVTQTGDVFHLDFYGDCFEEGYFELLSTISRSDVAPYIRSLNLRGPDEGTNGTRNWDLELLVATDVSFPQLATFSIQQYRPEEHNRSIVGADYDEGGVSARLLHKAPQLQELTVPSAPSREFFEVGVRPIRFLSVDAGYDTQDFIANLGKSSCFPDLRCFDWGEYHETYLDDFSTKCTALAHYRELWQSNAFHRVSRFVWRNPVCTDDEIKELKALKPDLQLFVVRYAGGYL